MEVFWTASTFSIQTMITAITDIVTGAIGWIGQFIDVLTDQPLLLFFVVFGLIGTGIGLISRLMRV